MCEKKGGLNTAATGAVGLKAAASLSPPGESVVWYGQGACRQQQQRARPSLPEKQGCDILIRTTTGSIALNPATVFVMSIIGAGQWPMKRFSNASGHWFFPLPGPTSGSAAKPTVTCRRPATMSAAANNTVT